MARKQLTRGLQRRRPGPRGLLAPPSSGLTQIVNAMMNRSTVPATRLISALALALAPAVCLIVFPLVVTPMLPVSDFREHIEFARQLGETGAMLPHFGYHALVVMVQALTPAD